MAGKNKIQEIRDALNTKFHERSELVDGMMTALLAKEMIFLLGPPGTAKSAICEALCQTISGSYFSWLLGKFTTPEELFGPPSLKGLENDEYKMVTKGKLPEANIAFLDEIFKGSSSVLNTLLPIINERIFFNDGKANKIPLQCLFGASNETPQGEELGALYDRFALKFVVNRLQNDESFAKLIAGASQTAQMPSMSMEELAEAQEAATAVTVPQSIIEILVKLRRAVDQEGMYVSDRKWVQSVRVIKAYACLNGNTEVQESDLDILEHSLWHDPEERKNVRRIVQKHSNPLGEQILKILDAVNEVRELLEKDQLDPIEARPKVKSAIEKLEKMGDPEKNTRLKQAIKKAKAVNLYILKDKLGME